jgi:hypothetical protein
MDDETAAWPLNTQDPMSAGLVEFISLLTGEANDPVGTGLTAQPVNKTGTDTATEAAITQQMNDMAQSLQSKVMQFGEQEFWKHWLSRYKRYAKDGDIKIAAIVGVKGTTFEKVDLGAIKTDSMPGVMIYSAKEAEYKELVLRRDLMTLYPQLMQTMDADGLRNFNKFVFMPKFLNDPSLVDIMFPKTLDEMKAEDENEQLKEDMLPEVAETDDHLTHIYTHMQVPNKTWATFIHLQWHEDLLAQQKAMQQQQAQMQMQQAAGQVEVGVEKQNPMAQASPLKSEITSNNQK